MILKKQLKRGFLQMEQNRKSIFSIRKLSVGIASVALGSVVYLGADNSEVDAAEEVNDGDQQAAFNMEQHQKL